MTDIPQGVLAEYTQQHRNRPSRENGSVKLVGKKQKKWEGTYHVYPNGERETRRKIIATKAECPTKSEALDRLRAWLRRQQNQPVVETAQATVAQLCDDYVALRQGGWEAATLATNTAVIEQLIKPAIGKLAICAITPEHLKRLVDELPKRISSTTRRKGISSSYATKCISRLREIFDLAEERELIRRNPARSRTPLFRLKTPRQASQPDKKIFPPSALPALVAHLNRQDSLIVRLSLVAATRPNELFALTGGDVVPGWIQISKSLDKWRKAKATKTNQERWAHIPPGLAEELAEWIQANEVGPADLLFRNTVGKPIDRIYFLKHKLRKAAARAGITRLDVDFQMLRRSFATLGKMAGLDVKSIQQQLGHSRADITANVYMQPLDALVAEGMARWEEMLSGRIPLPVDVEAKLGRVQ